MGKIASIGDFRAEARRRLPRLLFDYLDGGSYGEVTLKRNVQDFADLALRQRVMCDVSTLSMETTLFGQRQALPVGLAPVGFSGMFARRGEVQAARAAKAAGIPFCLSTVGVCSVEEVVEKTGAPIWYQLYMIRDRAVMTDLLARVKALGCPVLVFTVDLPAPGARYRDVHSGMSAPPGLESAINRAWQGLTHPEWLWDVQLHGKPHNIGNLASAVKDANGVGQFRAWVERNFDPTLTWKDIAWIRERWDGKFVIKGILDVEDARQAVAAGVDGIVVSNHGGRQLDGVSSTAKALPGIVDTVAGQATVLVDGGIRSGLDVLRALALGAEGCLLGRAWAYALAARGEAGVAQMLTILKAELAIAMMLTGCTDVRRASRALLA
jgi:L-lactate dehydrogenase (cytochrome)